MTPSIDPPIGEQLAWAQWWAFPWKYAHEDWRDDAHAAMDALHRRGGWAPCTLPGVVACLPPEPHATVLRLALASTEQLNLALTLVHDIFNPEASSALSDSHHLWCTRLSKALPPALLLPEADPLQLLYSWVDPSTWQRLRLRFPRGRVQEAEKKNAPSRVQTAN